MKDILMPLRYFSPRFNGNSTLCVCVCCQHFESLNLALTRCEAMSAFQSNQITPRSLFPLDTDSYVCFISRKWSVSSEFGWSSSVPETTNSNVIYEWWMRWLSFTYLTTYMPKGAPALLWSRHKWKWDLMDFIPQGQLNYVYMAKWSRTY